jgi:hypothetical protein
MKKGTGSATSCMSRKPIHYLLRCLSPFHQASARLLPTRDIFATAKLAGSLALPIGSDTRYSTFTSIFFVGAGATFGIRNVRTPFVYFASTFSLLTPSGSWIVRWNDP